MNQTTEHFGTHQQAASKVGSPKTFGHIPALDGLRGIAILLVLAVHLFPAEVRENVAHGNTIERIYQTTTASWIGVDLFFVLSGFLITGILLDTRDSEKFFLNFYARRSLRVFPLYFLLVAVGVAVAAVIGPGSDPDVLSVKHEQLWLWSYLWNVRAAHIGRWIQLRAGPLVYGQFWSLAVEEHFYLVWPFVLYFCRPRWLLRVTLALLAVGFCARTAYVLTHFSDQSTYLTVYVLTPFRLDGLLMGAATAMLVRRPRFAQWLRRFAALLPVLVIALFVAIDHYVSWIIPKPFVATLGYLILALGFSMIVGCASVADSRRLIRKVTELNWLRKFGKYSYAIYAFHLSIIAMVVAPLTQLLHPLLRVEIFADLAARFLAILISLIAAMVSWHLIEKHFVRLKRLFPHDGSSPLGDKEIDLKATRAAAEPDLPRI